MFATLARLMATPGRAARGSLLKGAPLTVANNPYKARKVWPPNFQTLNHQQQLRFEKKYKRRIAMASRSPKWEKGVKFAQLATIVAALIYLLFYSEFEWWGQQYKPVDEIRRKTAYLFGTMDPDQRYERRKDAPEAPPLKEEPKTTTK